MLDVLYFFTILVIPGWKNSVSDLLSLASTAM